MNFNRLRLVKKPDLEKRKTVVKEESILDSLENQILLFRKLEENVYKHRPDLDNFVGACKGTKFENEYTKEQIELDKSEAKKKRQAHELENLSKGEKQFNYLEGGFQLSEILQAMIVDRLNNNWFEDIKSIMTSDFDDLTVGIDSIMKHKKGGILGLSIDFTVTKEKQIIYDKLKREWENVKTGKITTIKYYQDPDTLEKGKLLVPKFIIIASKKDVEELAKAYIENDLETLKNHPFKYLFLQQIEEQLQAVFDFYEINKDNTKFKFSEEQYRRIESVIRILKEQVHMDDEMQKLDFYEYSKNSIGLDMIRRFRTLKKVA